MTWIDEVCWHYKHDPAITQTIPRVDVILGLKPAKQWKVEQFTQSQSSAQIRQLVEPFVDLMVSFTPSRPSGPNAASGGKYKAEKHRRTV